MPNHHNEEVFENAIEHQLNTVYGYGKGDCAARISAAIADKTDVKGELKMLYSIDGNQITDIPRRRQEQFNAWRNNLADSDYEAVIEAMNEYVNAVPHDKPFVSSFIPGSDWTGTVYEPLYRACNNNREHSGWFFGLIVWQVMIDHPEEWVFKPADSDGDVLGTTYWRRNG